MEPRPEENEVISFAHFDSSGFGVLAHSSLWWLLYYYGLRLHRGSSCYVMASLESLPTMSCGGPYFGWLARARGVHLPQMGGALIQLHPGLEDRYLSLDSYPSEDLGWQKSWLYFPNESPPLRSYSPDRLCGDLPKS